MSNIGKAPWKNGREYNVRFAVPIDSYGGELLFVSLGEKYSYPLFERYEDRKRSGTNLEGIIPLLKKILVLFRSTPDFPNLPVSDITEILGNGPLKWSKFDMPTKDNGPCTCHILIWLANL